MFKDKFKEANDSIHADEELINKVLALKNPETRTVIHRRKRITSYIPTAAAAVLVISATAASIPLMTKINDDSGVIYESAVTESSGKPSASADSSRELPESPKPFKPSDSGTENAESSSQKSTGIPEAQKGIRGSGSTSQSSVGSASNGSTSKSSSGSVSNGSTSKSSGGSVSNGSSPANGSGSTSSGSSTAITGGGSANGYSELVPIEEYNLPSAEKKQSIDLPNSADSFGKSENTDDSGILKRAAPKASEERVVLSMNTGAYAAAYSAAMPASVPFASEIGYAEWSYRDYFDYLGRMLSPALPSDFKLTEHDSVSITDEAFLSETFEMAVDEYGTPVFDNRIFVFDGSDGRYAGIQTSKDTSTAMTYLTDSNFTLSTIGSSYGVLIGTIEDCRAYMVCGNVSYVINAVGLNEDELKALLLSAAEG